MREVLLDKCYRFPGSIEPKVIVNLGANIGLLQCVWTRNFPSGALLWLNLSIQMHFWRREI